MYSDIFCRVYSVFGWNYYPQIFSEQLLKWIKRYHADIKTSLDLGCGTGVLCSILKDNGIQSYGMDLSAGMIAIAKENRPDISYETADMITFRPSISYDLVTCTGDALNHIADLESLEQIFRNVYSYINCGGYFIFDILNENEISSSEPFEMDFNETQHIWFQMRHEEHDKVLLEIRVSENNTLQFTEIIQETIYDTSIVCTMLERCGFQVLKCSNQLLDDAQYHGTTWFLIARKI